MFWLLTLFVGSILFYFFVVKKQQYWKDRGVSQQWQFPLLGGNVKLIFRTGNFHDQLIKMYNSFPNTRYIGTYQFLEPVLLIKDPDLIKQLAIKDFDHFTDHKQFIPADIEPLWAKNLFALPGTKWRHMRATLSPNFTSSKIKMMFNLMAECAKNYSEKILKDCKNKKEFDFKDISTRYGNDVIASTAFGIQVDSYTDRDNEFYRNGKVLTNFTTAKKAFIFFMYMASSTLSQWLGLRFFDKKPSDFFIDLVKRTIKMREEQNIVRQDLLHLLLQARKGAQNEDENEVIDTGFAVVEESHIGKEKTVITKEELTDIDICAQALIFFFAGFDSISTIMSFMSYELACNPDIQDRLRQEIDDTLIECNGKVTYEAIQKMKYLDMVVSESLRMWPNFLGVDRVCTIPYTIEPKTPEEKPIHLKENDAIWIAVIGLHKDPKYFPNPNKFDPERFSDKNKGNIKPYTYLPFGVGPRNCIGSRFALLEIKTLFFNLLSKLELLPSAKTPIPMKLKPGTFALLPDPGFYLDMAPRKTTVL